jgi:hypothetical protein
MLRKLEKGLNTAKLKSQHSEAIMPPYADGRGTVHYSRNLHSPPGSHFSSKDLPPLNINQYPGVTNYPGSSHSSRTLDADDDEDQDRTDDNLFPAKMISTETKRTSFFRTILNPEDSPVSGPGTSNSVVFNNNSVPNPRSFSSTGALADPITAGIIDEAGAKVLFDLIFLRLNPFINLFDPALHSVPYVREKCPFLFTTLIMAGCKFFRPELFKPCQKLASEFAVRAFAEAWKRVEVVQAFACLTYWKDPDDNVRFSALLASTSHILISVPGHILVMYEFRLPPLCVSC